MARLEDQQIGLTPTAPLLAGVAYVTVPADVFRWTSAYIDSLEKQVAALQKAYANATGRDAVVMVSDRNGLIDLSDLRVEQAFDPGGKIATIKRVRELTGCGLKEAKDWVDDHTTGIGLNPYQYDSVRQVMCW